MKKLTLSEWAAVAEVIGMILVIVSLTFVAFTIERNTAVRGAESDDVLFDSFRDISLLTLADPELSNLISRGRADFSTLSETDQLRYKDWLTLHIDNWARAIRREEKGLLGPEDANDWYNYYQELIQRSVTPQLWNDLKWNWGTMEIVSRIDSIFGK